MLTLHAHAKINITLDVLGKRPDGYHQVDTILQSIGLFDIITLAPDESLSIRVQGDAPSDERNLAFRAAEMLLNSAGVRHGAAIHIDKRIPTAAGLAGGSADAAAALLGLNRLWGLDMPLERLLKLAARLGADVPFCLTGGSMRGLGTGTELKPLPPMMDCAIVVCKPCEGLLTKDVFAALPLDRLEAYRPDTKAALIALEERDLPALMKASGNVLEAVTLPRRPEAKAVMELLAQNGAEAVRMSGSGPSVYGLFLNESAAKRAKNALPAAAFSILTRPCAVGCRFAGSAY